MEENEMSVFKSYLRNLLMNLENLQKAVQKEDKEAANEILETLIKNAKDGIED